MSMTGKISQNLNKDRGPLEIKMPRITETGIGITIATGTAIAITIAAVIVIAAGIEIRIPTEIGIKLFKKTPG